MVGSTSRGETRKFARSCDIKSRMIMKNVSCDVGIVGRHSILPGPNPLNLIVAGINVISGPDTGTVTWWIRTLAWEGVR